MSLKIAGFVLSGAISGAASTKIFHKLSLDKSALPLLTSRGFLGAIPPISFVAIAIVTEAVFNKYGTPEKLREPITCLSILACSVVLITTSAVCMNRFGLPIGSQEVFANFVLSCIASVIALIYLKPLD